MMFHVGWLYCAIFLAVFNFQNANAANILFFHHQASYSHLLSTWPMAEALANRGHQVSYIAPFQHQTQYPNITVFVPETMSKIMHQFIAAEFDINIRIQNKMPLLIDYALDLAQLICEGLFSSPEFENWLSHQTKIDLVIIDNTFPECGIGLAFKLGAKYAIFNTLPSLGYEYDAYGLVPETAAIPDLDFRPEAVPMGFLDRVYNAILVLRWRLHHYQYCVKIGSYIRSALKIPDMPPIGDLMAKVSLTFSTGNVITDYPRANPANVVNIAGIHCKESSQPLPQAMEKFIQANDTDGFVYISLGSMVISSNLPEDIKQVFFETIKSFPKLKFFWKWNGEFEKSIPENLFLEKWYPQQDVLGHAKIRAFVTQAGRPSAIEAISNAVPMIAFPIIADQDYNAERMRQTGAAIKLEIGTVTTEQFTEAIRKSVYDQSIKARLTKLQKAFLDRPMTSTETAIWHTEYILRAEDTEHLRAAGIEQNWFIRRQIDVWGFLSISIFVALISVIVIVTKIILKIFKTVLKEKKQ